MENESDGQTERKIERMRARKREIKRESRVPYQIIFLWRIRYVVYTGDNEVFKI